jgi:hypothetical protein
MVRFIQPMVPAWVEILPCSRGDHAATWVFALGHDLTWGGVHFDRQA